MKCFLNPLWKYQFKGRLKQLIWVLPRVSAAIVAKETPGKPLSRASEEQGLCGVNTADSLSGAVWKAEGMVCI